MINRRLKHICMYITVYATFSFVTFPCFAQTLAVTQVPDSQVLVSLAKKYVNIPKTGMEASFVNIKAVDAPVITSPYGKTSQGKNERYGQGIVIDSDGIIVTNKHVIGSSAHHIYVMMNNGKIVEAKVLHKSDKDDLAFIKINVTSPLTAIRFGDSSMARIGNQVTAFANSALDDQAKKAGKIIEVYKDAVTDNVAILKMNIPLKEGDSGGPIINDKGLLLGVIMANQVSDPSKSYAIAANKIQQEYFKYRKSILN